MIKLSQIQKITMAAVMIVLTIIFTRLLSIQNIPVIPFVRISLGPAVVILASLTLGPIYGGIVGGAADILGIVLFPNGFDINPILTIVYAASGVLPFFVYKLFSLIKKEKISLILLNVIFFSLFVATLLFFIFNSSIVLYGKTYNFLPWHKIVILSSIFIFTFLSLLAIYFINKSFKKKNEQYLNVYVIALTSLISEFIIKTIINSFVKSAMFEVDLLYIFMSEVLVLFINIPLYAYFVTYLSTLLKKFIHSKGL